MTLRMNLKTFLFMLVRGRWNNRKRVVGMFEQVVGLGGGGVGRRPLQVHSYSGR